jgi:GNAT superfamily N-acetyltransferase
MIRYRWQTLDPTAKRDRELFIEAGNLVRPGCQFHLRRRHAQTVRTYMRSFPQYRYLVLWREGTLVGRMACGLLDTSNHRDNEPKGFVGLTAFSSHQDLKPELITDRVHQLFPAAKAFLLPFFHSTWHSYRCLIQREFDLYLDSQLGHIPEWWHQTPFMQNLPSHHYRSALSPHVATIITKTARAHSRVKGEGFRLRRLNQSQLAQETQSLYGIALECFENQPFYQPITEQAFRALYQTPLKTIDPNWLTIAESPTGEPLGFLFSLPDDSRLLRRYDIEHLPGKLAFLWQRHRQARGVIIKTVAIRPQYQKRGLYQALFHHQLTIAKQTLGADYCVGAYVHEDNPSMRIIEPTTHNNRYRLYELPGESPPIDWSRPDKLT